MPRQRSSQNKKALSSKSDNLRISQVTNKTQDEASLAISQAQQPTRGELHQKKMVHYHNIQALLEGGAYQKEELLLAELESYQFYGSGTMNLVIHNAWIWLAFNAPSQRLRIVYLEYAKAINESSHFLDFNKSQVDSAENFIASYYGLPDAIPVLLPSETRHPPSHNFDLQLHISKLLRAYHRNEDLNPYCEQILDILVNMPIRSKAGIISDIVSLFVVFKLYQSLEKILMRLSMFQFDLRVNTHILIFLIELKVNLSKENTLFYIEELEEFAKVHAGGESSNIKLDSFITLLKNIAHGTFLEVDDLKSGESLLVNACNLMNPFNPKFSPKDALPLLEEGLTRTNQCGDITLEYIRCKLLLNKNYSFVEDGQITDLYIQYFTKIPSQYGWSWRHLSAQPNDYGNHIVSLEHLFQKIKSNIETYQEAYDNPFNKKSNVLERYNVQDFYTAFGDPRNYLALRNSLYQDNVGMKNSVLNSRHFAKVNMDIKYEFDLDAENNVKNVFNFTH